MEGVLNLQRENECKPDYSSDFTQKRNIFEKNGAKQKISEPFVCRENLNPMDNSVSNQKQGSGQNSEK